MRSSDFRREEPDITQATTMHRTAIASTSGDILSPIAAGSR